MAMRVMTMREWTETIHLAPAEQKAEVIGVSPGGAANMLGISRQAIHNAIHRDTLDATKVVTETGKLISINITLSELDRYRRQHLRKTG